MQHSSIDLKRNAEAARYAILRRLAPALRHDMAGGFQPVTMLATILEKRILAVSPDLSTLAKNSGEIRTLSISATHSSLGLMAWIAAEPDKWVSLGKGIKDSIHLVATELSLRGFKFTNQTEDELTDVKLDHLRGVFVATMLAMTDAAALPSNVLVTAALERNNMLVTLKLSDIAAVKGVTTLSEEFQVGLAAYRKIDWDDVQAIADVDGLTVVRDAASVTLSLPISTAER